LASYEKDYTGLHGQQNIKKKDALIPKFAIEKCESFVQYEATAAAGKDTASYKDLSYSSLSERRRFVTSVRDGMAYLHKDGIRVGYTVGKFTRI